MYIYEKLTLKTIVSVSFSIFIDIRKLTPFLPHFEKNDAPVYPKYNKF